MKSKFLNLNTRDFLRGLITAVGAAVAISVQNTLDSGSFPTTAELPKIGAVACSAAIGYLILNLFTNSNGQLKKE